MPELPEVETVKNVLLPIVKNRTVLSVDVLRKSIVSNLDHEFKKFMTGVSFLDITRRGKFLIFHLSDQKVLVSHLRMEGKYFELAENEANSKYARVVFHLDNHMKLCYDDSRSFGRMLMSDEATYLFIKPIIELGPEPFDINDVSNLYERGRRINVPIKSSLLSQKFFVGLGNIYVDEVLFKSGLHPLTPTKMLSKADWQAVIAHSKSVLTQAINSGGSTIRSYHPGKDISGNFQTQLQVYGRQGQKCVLCHRILRFIKIGGRGTTYCPKCQPRMHPPIKIAIVGKIAAGKSSVLAIFKKHGYCTISADAIVGNLYSQQVMKDRIIKKFKLSSDGEFIVNLRSYLTTHPQDLVQLEKMVHPLVKEEIIRTFSHSTSLLLVAEVPLLFKAKMQNMFDIIIAVDINEKNQINRLNLRDKDKSSFNKHINDENHQFNEHLLDIDYLINNDGSQDDLLEKVEAIINKVLNRLN